MTRTVVWAALHSSAPMGQQQHDVHLQRALHAHAGDGWRFELRTVAPLRARADGARRVPVRVLDGSPLRAAAAIGRAAYGRAALVHRLDLRLPPRPGREVVTVHDLPPLRFDDEGSLPRWAVESGRRSLGVVCPSEFAADEVRELLGARRVWVVPYGLTDGFGPGEAPSDAELDRLGVRRPYVLHAAGATRRKNLAGLAGAWRIVGSALPEASLVLCGPPDARREELFGRLPGAVLLGRVEPAAVARLMRGAAAVVVPSLYEGFGLPALEGMACGAPVVAARRGALPEVCGDAALLVDPDAAGIAAGLLEVMEDESVAEALRRRGAARAAGFSWDEAARRTLEVYEEALA